MRIALIVGSFLPFLYYAAKDNYFHFHGRKVSLTEHLLHLVIGIALFIAFSQAVLGHTLIMVVGLLFFLVAGALDEYVWHRNIPEVESDLHAKEHLALMIFVVVTLVVNWFEKHQWQLPPELLELFGSSSPTAAKPGATRVPLRVDPWRAVAFPMFLIPYAYYGLNDNLQHFKHRHVPWAERTLHLTIVLAVIIVVSNGIMNNSWVMLTGLILFLIARAADEWIFHTGLSGKEVDQHAKTHFAFLAFLILISSFHWLPGSLG